MFKKIMNVVSKAADNYAKFCAEDNEGLYSMYVDMARREQERNR